MVYGGNRGNLIYYMQNIKISRIGIGDLILLSSELIFKNKTNNCFSINQDLLNTYKSKDAHGYKSFVKALMTKFFQGYNISFSDDQTFPTMEFNWEIIQKAIREKRISDHFKSIFSHNETPSYEYYCIMSKVRSFPRNEFDLIKSDFFKIINKKNVKLIVLGEKEIEYGPEYQVYGNSMIYSIYKDIMESVNPNLIVDMTVPKLGETTPNINNIIKDMAIIKNSKKALVFGHGGFFCTTLFTHKLCAIIEKRIIENEIPNEINKQVFITRNSFLEAV